MTVEFITVGSRIPEGGDPTAQKYSRVAGQNTQSQSFLLHLLWKLS